LIRQQVRSIRQPGIPRLEFFTQKKPVCATKLRQTRVSLLPDNRFDSSDGYNDSIPKASAPSAITMDFPSLPNRPGEDQRIGKKSTNPNYLVEVSGNWL